jgi:hypothetical protein
MVIHPATNDHLYPLFAENYGDLFWVVSIRLQALPTDFLLAIDLYDHDPLTVPESGRDSRAVKHDGQLHD